MSKLFGMKYLASVLAVAGIVGNAHAAPGLGRRQVHDVNPHTCPCSGPAAASIATETRYVTRTVTEVLTETAYIHPSAPVGNNAPAQAVGSAPAQAPGNGNSPAEAPGNGNSPAQAPGNAPAQGPGNSPAFTTVPGAQASPVYNRPGIRYTTTVVIVTVIDHVGRPTTITSTTMMPVPGTGRPQVPYPVPGNTTAPQGSSGTAYPRPAPTGGFGTAPLRQEALPANTGTSPAQAAQLPFSRGTGAPFPQSSGSAPYPQSSGGYYPHSTPVSPQSTGGFRSQPAPNFPQSSGVPFGTAPYSPQSTGGFAPKPAQSAPQGTAPYSQQGTAPYSPQGTAPYSPQGSGTAPPGSSVAGAANTGPHGPYPMPGSTGQPMQNGNGFPQPSGGSQIVPQGATPVAVTKVYTTVCPAESTGYVGGVPYTKTLPYSTTSTITSVMQSMIPSPAGHIFPGTGMPHNSAPQSSGYFPNAPMNSAPAGVAPVGSGIASPQSTGPAPANNAGFQPQGTAPVNNGNNAPIGSGIASPQSTGPSGNGPYPMPYGPQQNGAAQSTGSPAPVNGGNNMPFGSGIASPQSTAPFPQQNGAPQSSGYPAPVNGQGMPAQGNGLPGTGVASPESTGPAPMPYSPQQNSPQQNSPAQGTGYPAPFNGQGVAAPSGHLPYNSPQSSPLGQSQPQGAGIASPQSTGPAAMPYSPQQNSPAQGTGSPAPFNGQGVPAPSGSLPYNSPQSSPIGQAQPQGTGVTSPVNMGPAANGMPFGAQQNSPSQGTGSPAPFNAPTVPAPSGGLPYNGAQPHSFPQSTGSPAPASGQSGQGYSQPRAVQASPVAPETAPIPGFGEGTQIPGAQTISPSSPGYVNQPAAPACALHPALADALAGLTEALPTGCLSKVIPEQEVNSVVGALMNNLHNKYSGLCAPCAEKLAGSLPMSLPSEYTTGNGATQPLSYEGGMTMANILDWCQYLGVQAYKDAGNLLGGIANGAESGVGNLGGDGGLIFNVDVNVGRGQGVHVGVGLKEKRSLPRALHA